MRPRAKALVPARIRRALGEPTPGQLEEPWPSAIANSLVTPLNLHFLHELTERLGRLRIDGDIVECGVYRGGSAAVLGWAMMRLEGPPRKLWLFDSFAGMPAATERDGDFSHTLEGKYVGSAEETRRLLRVAGLPEARYELVVGRFEETFPSLEPLTTALLHVDCDFYEPVRLTLEKFFPSLSPGGFVVLNDYGAYKGAHDATNEFLAANGLEVELVAIDPTASFFQKPGAGFSGLPMAGHYPGFPGPVA